MPTQADGVQYFLWVEINTDRSSPGRTYSDATINVIPPAAERSFESGRGTHGAFGFVRGCERSHEAVRQRRGRSDPPAARCSALAPWSWATGSS